MIADKAEQARVEKRLADTARGVTNCGDIPAELRSDILLCLALASVLVTLVYDEDGEG